MKHTAKTRMCLLSLLLMFGFVNAQDTRFSQPLNNQLSLNPAMMGLTNDCRISLNYRNQWATIDNGYVTYAVSVLYPLFLHSRADSSKREFGKSRLDFGFNILDDKSGGFNRTDITLSVSYGLKLNAANSVHAALNFGYIRYAFNASSQSFDEQFQLGVFNPQLPTCESLNVNKGAPDVGLGFMYPFAPEHGKVQAFAGLAGFHVNQPNMSLNNGDGTLPARFNFQAGVKIIGNKMDFTPVVIYDIQGPFKQFIGGLLAYYKFGQDASKGKLVVGAWYKESDAVAVQVGYDYKYFLFGYSYDFGISQLARVTSGLMTHELTLAIKIYDAGAKKGIKGPLFL